MKRVGIVGSGTMGAGVAQIAALAGWHVLLFDVDPEKAAAAIRSVTTQLGRLVEKGKLPAPAADEAAARLSPAPQTRDLADCELIFEAVVENLMIKSRVLREIAAYAAPQAIFATNTSSLSIDRIGQGCGQPGRTVGMHFFNPVPLLPLVEVVRGERSHPAAAERVTQIAREWGKTPVQVRDTPGFIVNRVARGYYLEPMRLLGEGVAGVDELDRTLRQLGGFRMGPFELTDLIGHDVNYAVSLSVWEQFNKPPRLTPHELQRELVEHGRLGRKTRLGWYRYESDPAVPAVPVARRSFTLPGPLAEAVRRFCERAAVESGSLTEQYVLARTLAAIINEAGLALDDHTASPADIDTAMKLGANYPRGPIEWAERVGRHTCRHVLEALNASVPDARYRPAAWLTQ
jgi:3-hydroxybutyryl-CoA dehydrogenase